MTKGASNRFLGNEVTRTTQIFRVSPMTARFEIRAEHTDSQDHGRPASFAPGSEIGRFRVGLKIGAGAMAEIYLAEDTKLGRLVALKRLHPKLSANKEARQRMLLEAQGACVLNHQNIIQVHDLIEENDEVFLVMEYVEGATLRAKVGKLAMTEFFHIAEQCLEGLTAAHESSLVHQDIKPENILVTKNNRVKICDFGLVWQMTQASLWTVINLDSTFRGTLIYAAPDAFLGRRPDGLWDVFSLGVVFYELLSGLNPFLSGSLSCTIERILYHTPDRLSLINSRVPVEISQVVERMLKKEPEHRPSSRECLSQIRAVAASFTGRGQERMPTRSQRYSPLYSPPADSF